MQAVDFARQRHLENLTAGGLIELGLSFSSRGDYPQAEKYFKEAIELSRAQRWAAARSYRQNESWGASIFINCGLTRGWLSIRKHLSFFRQGNYPRQILISLDYIGRSQRQKGDYDAALNTFAEKLERAKQGGDQPQIAFAFGEIGSVLAEREQYAEALRKYSESYEIIKSLDNTVQLAYNNHNRGNMLWNLGRYADAQSSLDEALKIASQPGIDYQQLLAEIELSFAQIALSKSEFGDARRASNESSQPCREQIRTGRNRRQKHLGSSQSLFRQRSRRNGGLRKKPGDCPQSR